mmetsp:Transcript_31826/g.53704  ORF Transcript_31826/g.53704 Transcript_31826/m.53704 type:complete len:478 (+) Transcript_31826:79-1512(+)
MRSSRLCKSVAQQVVTKDCQNVICTVMNSAPAIADLSYRELQAKAKEHGIPANKKKDFLIDEILKREMIKSSKNLVISSTIPRAANSSPLTPHSKSKPRPRRKATEKKGKSVHFLLPEDGYDTENICPQSSTPAPKILKKAPAGVTIDLEGGLGSEVGLRNDYHEDKSVETLSGSPEQDGGIKKMIASPSQSPPHKSTSQPIEESTHLSVSRSPIAEVKVANTVADMIPSSVQAPRISDAPATPTASAASVNHSSSNGRRISINRHTYFPSATNANPLTPMGKWSTGTDTPTAAVCLNNTPNNSAAAAVHYNTPVQVSVTKEHQSRHYHFEEFPDSPISTTTTTSGSGSAATILSADLELGTADKTTIANTLTFTSTTHEDDTAFGAGANADASGASTGSGASASAGTGSPSVLPVLSAAVEAVRTAWNAAAAPPAPATTTTTCTAEKQMKSQSHNDQVMNFWLSKTFAKPVKGYFN